MSVRAATGIVSSIVLAIVLTACVDLCGNEKIAEYRSPDGELALIVFQRDCGATTGFSTQASLIRSGVALPNESGNIFTADTNRGAAPSGEGGGPQVRVEWRDSRHLVLRHHVAARTGRMETRYGDIDIAYDTFR